MPHPLILVPGLMCDATVWQPLLPALAAHADCSVVDHGMADSLTTKMADPSDNWASFKKTSIMHLARIPSFSRTDLPVGGYSQALNAVSENHGPSWRMVVALGDEVKAWGVFPGGQSGNPGSPFYETGLDKWMKGEYNELFFMKNEADNRKPVIYSIEIN